MKIFYISIHEVSQLLAYYRMIRGTATRNAGHSNSIVIRYFSFFRRENRLVAEEL
jgi:hypothetical protein